MSDMPQENINQNNQTVVEAMPEAFGRVVMLYVSTEVECHKINAFMDSGAQSTIMNAEWAEKRNLMRDVLRRRGQGREHGQDQVRGIHALLLSRRPSSRSPTRSGIWTATSRCLRSLRCSSWARRRKT